MSLPVAIGEQGEVGILVPCGRIALVERGGRRSERHYWSLDVGGLSVQKFIRRQGEGRWSTMTNRANYLQVGRRGASSRNSVKEYSE